MQRSQKRIIASVFSCTLGTLPGRPYPIIAIFHQRGGMGCTPVEGIGIMAARRKRGLKPIMERTSEQLTNWHNML